MIKNILTKEERKISTTPHTGISEAQFRLVKTQPRWISEFIGDTRKEIHKTRRKTSLNHEVWRKERAIQYGKDTPQNTTINQEISTLRRALMKLQSQKDLSKGIQSQNYQASNFQKTRSTEEMT